MRRRLSCALLAVAMLWAVDALAQVKINEIRIDNTGTDTDEYFDQHGDSDLHGYRYEHRHRYSH